MSYEDVFAMKVQDMATFTKYVHEECFKQSASRTDWPALTVEEGSRFRNCIHKYSVWLPTLDRNLRNSAYHYNLEKIIAKQNPELLDGSAGLEVTELADLAKHYQQL